MRSSAGLRRWINKAPGLITGAVLASPAVAATNDLASAWSMLLDHDGATLLLYGSIGLLGLALVVKFAAWAEERRNYHPHFFPTDRQIPIEPAAHS